jgi:hypothetical protein
MEEKNEIKVMSGVKEKKQYDSFIYSLPFKSGAIISSLVIFVLGITCVIAFMWLWEEDIYSMTANEAAEYIAHYGGGKANIPPLAEALINLRYAVVPIGITLGILYLVDIVFIFAAIGHKRGSNELVKFPTSDWPFDIICLLYLMFFSVTLEMSTTRINGREAFGSNNIACLIMLVVCYFFILSFFLNAAINLKDKTLFKNMLIIRFFRYIFRGIGKAIRNSGVTKKATLYFGMFAGAEFVILLMFNLLGTEVTSALLFLLFLVNIFAFIVIYKVMMGVKEIETAEQKIIAGNLDYKLNTAGYKGDLKILAEGLNEIGTGLENAVNGRMKSERFKTELITNVSHDIKTPLTSIINYTDLLKKENIETEPVKGYIEVLDRQSERLKKLITDLLEASKASSGNIKLDIAEVDAGLMLEQVYGEYQNKFEKAGLTGIVTKPSETVFIKADANHLFRVFDNILGNVVKYAQPGTRVYIDLTQNDETITISFKNISKEKLNITGEELMERFVRGDRSRNTEGSGLGLSIAKSLANLMGGKLEIVIDGDLFKVEVRFNNQGRI